MKKIILITLIAAICSANIFAQINELASVATLRLTREEPITVRQLRTEVERVQNATGQTLTVAQRKDVLEAMINERLVLQAAARDRVTITENEINQQMQQLRNVLAQNIGRAPTDAEFAQAVRNEYNMEVTAFREQMQRQMLVQKYLMTTKQTLLQSIRMPTEQEIADHYNLIRAQLVRPETVRFTMIMVPFGNDRAAARQTADRLHREIGSNPATFDEVAARGAARDSGYQAGDAGYIPRNQEARNALGQALLDAAFNTRQGQVSGVIEGTQGFCIIKVTENHSQRQLELTDIFQLGTRMTVRDYIGQMMLNERQQAILIQASEELVSELRAAGTIRINENNLNW